MTDILAKCLAKECTGGVRIPVGASEIVLFIFSTGIQPDVQCLPRALLQGYWNFSLITYLQPEQKRTNYGQ